MATRFSRQYDARTAKIRANRKSPYELGKLHARIGRSRDDCPWSPGFETFCADWYRGYDEVKLEK